MSSYDDDYRRCAGDEPVAPPSHTRCRDYGETSVRPWHFQCAANGECNGGPGDYWNEHGQPVCVECCGHPERPGLPADEFVRIELEAA